MVIPIGTDVRLRRRPIANYILIGLNVFIFLLGQAPALAPVIDRALPPLNGAAPALNEYITYQFRHGDLWHLLGNMLFLWIFGNAVCDRIGSLNYAIFYLAGGVFAAVVFARGNNNLMLGASGAIAAVTTAFLVLYPRVHVTLLIWVFWVIPIQLPAMVVIVFKIILWDNIVAPRFGTGVVSSVAYSAHLGGYAFGFAAAMILLAVRALPRNQFDMLALWDRWNRRTGALSGLPLRAGPARPVSNREIDSRPLDPLPLSSTEQLREDILDRIDEHDMNEAARLYRRLREIHPELVLPRPQQLEIANHFAQSQRQQEAVDAYEAFLRAYPTAADSFQVRLLVGLVCRRYLRDYPRAAAHLRAALGGLTHPAQRQLAVQELELAEAGQGPAAGGVNRGGPDG